MRPYCLNDDEIVEILRCVRSATDPTHPALATALEDAKHWEAGLIILSLFVARVLERYRGQWEQQVNVIKSLHDPTPSLWFEIQEMDHHYIRQLFMQDPGAGCPLDEILMEVAQRIAVYDYA